MNRGLQAIWATLGPALWLAQPVQGDVFTLYGSQTTDSSAANWGLVRFDSSPVTGQSVRVGRGGLMFDMDFDAAGQLYAPRGSTGLTRVNTTTGAQTLVGGWGLGGKIINAIAFAPNGALYGVDNEALNTSLYAINKQTGLATRIGAVGNYVFGLDFADDGTLYGASGEIFTINTTTGTEGQVVVPYTGAFITALDYGADGIFRGIETFYQSSFSALREIELDGQSLTFIGQTTEADMAGLASIPSPPALLLLGLGVIGIAARRR